MVILFALGSALLYALASVWQQEESADADPAKALRPALLVALMRRPRWVAGIVADVAAYALQFLALGRGGLVIVQPLLVSGLLFALPLGARRTGQRLRRLEWAGAVAVVGGLSLFLAVASPTRGRADTSGSTWLVVALAVIGPGALLVLAGLKVGPGSRRAALLAAAGGLLYGLTAALTKTAAHQLDQGLGALLSSWQAYVLLAAGVGGMVVVQSAFQAGPLRASLPAITVVDPVASIAIGALAFGEGIANRGVAPFLELAGLAAMALGVLALARSPLVEAGAG